jgi:hypothetical protein
MIRALLIANLAAGLAACQPDSLVGSNLRSRADGGRDRSACSDDLDNDDDGETDYPFDPGCVAPSDDDETDPLSPPACSDGADNDGDQIADFPLEPGCESAADDDETDPPFPPECSDGIDNDFDGLIDYPEDDGCLSASGSETIELD